MARFSDNRPCLLVLLPFINIVMKNTQQSPKILVTVGTTEFDALIEYTSSPTFLKALAKNELGKLPITYQIGSTY